ncbi:MAG: nuclear transport factor 2 family protein [Pseudomonadota bacterium]
MSELANDVRNEIVDLHRFFVGWFNGTLRPQELDSFIAPRLDDQTFYVTPDGNRLERDDLIGMLRQTHGSNPAFRIEVRDVRIRRDYGDYVLATYTEWQKGARASAQSENARMTTVLLAKTQPIKWLHIHETWLPEAVRAAGSFDF